MKSMRTPVTPPITATRTPLTTEQAIAGIKKADVVVKTSAATVGARVRPAVTAEQRADIENRFTFHPVVGDQAQRYIAIREKAKELAILIIESVPVGREQAIALTQLEQTVMNANAGIARHG